MNIYKSYTVWHIRDAYIAVYLLLINERKTNIWGRKKCCPIKEDNYWVEIRVGKRVEV